MKIVTMSDVHGKYDELEANNPVPQGDILLMAGDLLPNFSYGGKYDGGIQCGYIKQVFTPLLKKWKDEGRFREIVVVAGNHDWAFQHYTDHCRSMLKDAGIVYLQDEQFIFDGVKIWGSPWQPWFYDWAFNFPNHHLNPARGRAHARGTWGMIPDDTEILVTHGPPMYTLDRTLDGISVGCPWLQERIGELPQLLLHVFGHIHWSYGQTELDGVTYVNTAICAESYRAENPCHVIDWDRILNGGRDEGSTNGSTPLGEDDSNQCSSGEGIRGSSGISDHGDRCDPESSP